MLTYAAFVAELRPLIERAHALRGLSRMKDDDAFRRWRHELEDIVDRIEAQNYRVNCSISDRAFDRVGGYSYSPTPKERMAAYNRDVEDTIAELETLVSRFEKFGDPLAEQPSSASCLQTTPASELPKTASLPLEPPERLTLNWIWQHATLKLYAIAGSALFAAFSGGAFVGQSPLYAEVMNKHAPDKQLPASLEAKRAGLTDPQEHCLLFGKRIVSTEPTPLGPSKKAFAVVRSAWPGNNPPEVNLNFIAADGVHVQQEPETYRLDVAKSLTVNEKKFEVMVHRIEANAAIVSVCP